MANNPTVEKARRAKDADFIPMGMTELQLSVPEIEGFKIYWFADRPGRISRAQRQGWEFVMDDEVEVMNFKTIAGSVLDNGNQDLGSRVSVYGGSDDQGRSVGLYLMKLPEQRWKELEAFRESQSDRTIDAILGGRVASPGGETADQSHRYSPAAIKNTIFAKKKR